MIAEIQVVPTPTGTAQDRWAHVDAAIAVIVCSGLPYEVGPLGTTVEGDPDLVWATLRHVHEAALAHGATSVVTVIKVLEAGDDTPTMRALTDPHRTRRD
jgi:uncharacterized protein YqgV (UPF0045/DUF77 family)